MRYNKRARIDLYLPDDGCAIFLSQYVSNWSIANAEKCPTSTYLFVLYRYILLNIEILEFFPPISNSFPQNIIPHGLDRLTAKRMIDKDRCLSLSGHAHNNFV